MTGTLEAALRYAGCGWPVLPLVAGAKVPATAHGVNDATTDPEQIVAWWAGRSLNVGIACGAPGPDALDIDFGTNPEAAERAYGLLKQAGLLRGAFAMVGTRNGGLHLYFAGTAQGNAAGIGGNPVDFRGKGGYVVAPPSAVEPGRYEVLDRRPLSEAGPFDLAAARRLLGPARPPRWPKRAAAPAPGRLVDWLDAEGTKFGRHDRFFWAANRMADDGADPGPLTGPGARIGLEPEYMARTIEQVRRSHGMEG